MMQRTRLLAQFLIRQYCKTASFWLLILLGLGGWFFYFNPLKKIIIDHSSIGLLLTGFGGLVAFISTVRMAGRASNSDLMESLFYRLPSRIDYLLGILRGSVVLTILVQAFFLAIILVLPNRPNVTPEELSNLPPVWIAVNILFSVLGLHASELAKKGWSRVWLFGTISILLFMQSYNERNSRWLAQKINKFSYWLTDKKIDLFGDTVRNFGRWIDVESVSFFDQYVGMIFWPFRAISDGIQSAVFVDAQVWSPAVLLIYAMTLFLLVSVFFSRKDFF